MGTGIARGFLAAMDSAWMVRHLIDTGDSRDTRVEMENAVNSRTPKLMRNESVARSNKLLNWCQRQTEGFRNVNVTDLTMSWKSGLALCAIIHRYRPDLIVQGLHLCLCIADFDSLEEQNMEKNNQLAFDVAEREFGISPIMTGKEMASVGVPDKLSMVMYLTQFYEMFKDTLPPGDNHNLSLEDKAALISNTKSPISFLSKLGQSISRKRNPKDKKEKEVEGTGKRRKTSQSEDEDPPRSYRDERAALACALSERKIETGIGNQNKVKSMATQLLAKFEENAPAQSSGLKRQMPPIVYSDDQVPIFTPSIEERASQITTHFEQKPDRRQRYIKMYTGGVSSLAEQITNQLQKKDQPKPFLDKKALGSFRREFPQNIGGSDVCFFCRKRVYVMERLSAEGKFFHRSCFKCDYCNTTLRLSSYAFDVEDGKFYCKPHYCYRLSGYAQRKRPAEAPLTAKENKVSLPDPVAADGPVRANATATPTERTPAVDVNGVEEPGLAKRLRGTPERIELENYRLSLQREEELEEVPEETLAEHNLSSVLDKGTDAGEGSSSSEMDEVEEEGEDEDHPVSDLGGVPWKQAVHLHARLKGKSETQIAAEEEARALGEEEEEEEDEDDEEDDDEEEKEEEEESSEAIKKTRAEVALLIDSNGKYLDTRRLFPGRQVNKIRCVNTERALQLLDRHTLGSPACIIIHTGTNDLGSLRQHTGRAMKRVAERASLEFPDSRVVISTLLPRADTPPHIIDAINSELARGCATLPNVHLAHHPAVGPWHLYDKVHLNKKGVGVFARTLKDAALGRGPTSPRLNTPSRAQRSKKPPGATAHPPAPHTLHAAPPQPPRTWPVSPRPPPARPNAPQQQLSYAAALAQPPPHAPNELAGNLRIQQVLQPVDPLEIQADVHWTHIYPGRLTIVSKYISSITVDSHYHTDTHFKHGVIVAYLSPSSSEMDEVEEEGEDEDHPVSDLGGVPWKQAVHLHARLKGKSETQIAAEEEARALGEEEEEEDEDEDDEEDDDEEEKEEEEESSEAGNLRIQQVLQPVDPLEIQADVHWTHICSEQEKEGAPTSQPSPSTDRCGSHHGNCLYQVRNLYTVDLIAQPFMPGDPSAWQRSEDEDDEEDDDEEEKEEEEESSEAIKKTRAEVALLIDSNGKYLDTRRLFPGRQVNKIRCVNTERALQLLDRHTLGSPACIIIHTGTNDLGSLRQHTGRAMKRVAERASLEFPDSRVVISTLLPRADTPPHIIDAINSELARGCATLPNVHLAHHPAVGPWHLYDKVHLNKKGVGVFARTLKDAALGRGPTSPRLNTPSRAQRSKKPPGATAHPPAPHTLHAAPPQPPRTWPVSPRPPPARPNAPQQQLSYAAALAQPPPHAPNELAGNLRIQQVLQPVDPLEIQADVHWTHICSEQEKEGAPTSQPSPSTAPDTPSVRHEAVRAWLETASGAPCEENELEVGDELGVREEEPEVGIELDEDDIPSDAEAEAQMHRIERKEQPPDEEGESDGRESVSSIAQSSVSPVRSLSDVLLSPVTSMKDQEVEYIYRTPCEENELEVGDEPGVREEEPEVGSELDEDDIPLDAEAEAQMHRIERKEQPPDEEGESDGRESVSSIAQSSVSPVRSLSDVLLSPVTSMKDQEVEGVCETLLPASLLKSPGARFFQEPYLPKEGEEDIISETPEAKTLISPTLPFSPVRFQPLPLPEAVMPKSPVKMRPSASPPATSPVCAHSPICSQPLPSTEPSSPVLSRSPVQTQPVPAFASTPLVKPIVESETLEKRNSISPSADNTVKKTDIIEEFWVKSAEIRKSLGLTPLDRSKGSENSFPESTPESSPPRSDTPEELSEEQKLYPSRPQPALRRLNIATIDRHQLSNLIIESPSEKELKSSDTEKKDVGSSSGLGLNGSMANTQTLTSESFNTSESTMLTPPSSPPPPPPENEEPATLRRNKYQASWNTVPEPTPVPALVPQKAPAAAPNPAPSPVPPQTRSEFRQEPSRKSREEVCKSFVESVDEIPFADDVEDTYDDRTPDTSFQEKFYTPPTSKPKQEKPLFHMALAMENGKLNLGEGATTKRQQAMPAISPEAKEVAEERMRAREKSVKSQALKDAMAKQLTKMKEVEAVKGGDSAKAVWNVESSRPKVSPLVSKSNIPSAVKSLESKKHEKTADKFLSPLGGRSLESSVASSEGSTSGKSKKRTSLFSPRKNKKEKKPKSEGRLSDKHNSEEAAKPKSLWKTVFSGYKKDKKKKEDKSCPSTPSSVTTVDSGKKGASPVIRATELRLRRHLSFSEDSDLSCDDVLERSSQKSKTDFVNLVFFKGMGKKDDPKLMQEWFKLVQEKNALVRYESELMIFARELELEDRQSRLQQELRERMAVDDHLKTEEELAEEKRILNEMLEVVEQRDSLVALLEEQRLSEREEDKDLEEVMLSKGFNLNWS
ncbi:UNVERIFIED_CONTAM: hypothetical protein FKN15_041936 [Acipenser sinensis]